MIEEEVSYSLDTNSLLTAWYQTYRPVSFPSFWNQLDALMLEGRAFISSEVKNELARKDDDVYQWVNARTHAIIELDAEQLVLARALATDFPALAKQRMGRQIADGFVIALAQHRDLTVVTAENHRGREKIPNICDESEVPCIALADLIANEGWTF